MVAKGEANQFWTIKCPTKEELKKFKKVEKELEEKVHEEGVAELAEAVGFC